MRVLLGISCCLDFSKTFLNHRKSYKHLTLQLRDVTFYFTLSAYEPTVAQKGHTCKLKMLLQTKNLTCKLKMLLQIKNSTCKLKIVHAN